MKIHALPTKTYLKVALIRLISHKVIWRLLHEEGRRQWLVFYRPALTPEHAAGRLTWAREYEHLTPQD